MNFVLWIIAATVQVAIGFIGVLAINGEFAKKHFAVMVLSFAALSIVGMAASGWAFIRAERYGAMAEELTKRILYEVKGSPDSYLLVTPNLQDVVGKDSGEVEVQIYNPTVYPVIDATISTNGAFGTRRPDFQASIGDVRQHSGVTLTRLRMPVTKEHTTGYYFSIQCRACILFAKVYVNWNGDHWTSATEISRRAGGSEEVVVELPDRFVIKGPNQDADN